MAIPMITRRDSAPPCLVRQQALGPYQIQQERSSSSRTLSAEYDTSTSLWSTPMQSAASHEHAVLPLQPYLERQEALHYRDLTRMMPRGREDQQHTSCDNDTVFEQRSSRIASASYVPKVLKSGNDAPRQRCLFGRRHSDSSLLC